MGTVTVDLRSAYSSNCPGCVSHKAYVNLGDGWLLVFGLRNRVFINDVHVVLVVVV